MTTSQADRTRPFRCVLVVGCLLAGGAVGTVIARAAPPAQGAQTESAAPPFGIDTVERFEFERAEMAVPVRLLLYAPDEAVASEAAAAAFDEIHRLNRIFSDYDSESELRELCRTAGEGRAVPVSDDLWHVLLASQRMAKRTDGAFDVTVGPVGKLWRRARRRHRLPPPERLEAARQAVGYRLIRLHPDGREVELLRPGMRLDLGGIAKGYAADAALRVLRGRGIRRVLINAGGDVRAGEPPPGRVGWRVGIDAGGSEPPPRGWLSLTHAAVATSGDAWQYVEIDGVRYSHLVDPRTGRGLTDHGTVSVLAPTAMLADALASAVSVLGAEEGLKLIEQYRGAAVQIVRPSKKGPQVERSSGWPRMTHPQAGNSLSDE